MTIPRRIHTTVFCLLSLALLFGPASAQDSVKIKIMCYNTAHGAGGTDGILNIQRIAGIINSEAPDLVGLQEIDSVCSRSNNVNQPSEYARLTSMNAVFGKAIPLSPGGYGNTILTKRPFTNVRKIALPGAEARQATFVDVALLTSGGNTDSITFSTSHFMVSDAASQLQSAVLVNNYVTQNISATQPIIFCGDLNAQSGSATLVELAKQWTIPSFNFGIDWIMYRPVAKWKLVSVRKMTTGDAAIASDHVPVVMELTLVGSSTGAIATNSSISKSSKKQSSQFSMSHGALKLPLSCNPNAIIEVFDLKGTLVTRDKAAIIGKINARLSNSVYIWTIKQIWQGSCR